MDNYDLTKTHIVAPTGPIALATHDLEVLYGGRHRSMVDASLQFPQNTITALIGASGSGKSTYLRSLNRMNDRIATVNGQIMYRDTDINAAKINVYELRKHIGMVFQQPNPFAKSIYDNITFALKADGITDKAELDQRVQRSLEEAALWDEVKNSLNRSALSLSGGQQQRLCIARTLAMAPDILLLDEPASALDPISTAKLEMTLKNLAKSYTIIIVTHNMQQASRISEYTAFFHLGHVLEFDHTTTIFQKPTLEITHDYVTGNFG